MHSRWSITIRIARHSASAADNARQSANLATETFRKRPEVTNGRVAEVTRAVAPDAWRRNVELFLDAIRPERAHPLHQGPMTPSQVYRSMMPPAPGTPRPAGKAASRTKKDEEDEE